MNDNTAKTAEPPPEPRRRGRPPGPQNPRKMTGIAAGSIIRAAGRAGYAHATIDSDGKITLQMIPPATAPADKADNEWNELLKAAPTGESQG